MRNSKLINSLAITFLLGTGCLALADEQSKANDQITADEPSAKSGAVIAAPVANNTDELAKKLSNPISSLISVPFQYNYSRT